MRDILIGLGVYFAICWLFAGHAHAYDDGEDSSTSLDPQAVEQREEHQDDDNKK